MQDKPQLAFVLALIGGLLSIGTAVMMGMMMTFIFGFAPAMPMGGFPFPFMGILFGWLALGSIVGGILMLVSATKIRRPAEVESARTLAFVGGGIAIIGGNVLGGALGIVAGALMLDGLGR